MRYYIPPRDAQRGPRHNAAVLGLLLFVVTACAAGYGGSTGYTKANPIWGIKYGYSDKAIGEGEYSVVVTGNLHTTREQVADIALLRAAHLAREHDRTHFTILTQATHELTSHELVTAPVAGLAVWLPVDELDTKEPHAVLLIRLAPRGSAPPEDALNAAVVIQEVGARVGEIDGT